MKPRWIHVTDIGPENNPFAGTSHEDRFVKVYLAPDLDSREGPGEEEDALALAIRFHDLYERLAPTFGYETRKGTRQFDPASQNGRLMVAVCGEVLRLGATRRSGEANGWAWEFDDPRGFGPLAYIQDLKPHFQLYTSGKCAPGLRGSWVRVYVGRVK